MRKEKLYIFLFLLLLWLPLITQCGTESELRILFIGNSYTYYNNLPHIFQSLAKSSGHLVKTGMIAKGGYTLKRHSEDPSVLDKIKRGNWDYVILQEQSVVPSVDYQFEDYMLPAVSLFEETIRTSNAEPVLFMTWGRENGIEKYNHNNFQDMQEKLYTAYMNVSNEFQISVAPVGIAWQQVVEKHPEIRLWQEDGSHPSRAGSYLAACVFYCLIFQESPEGLNNPMGASPEIADILQQVAAEITLGQIEQWQIDN